MAERNTTPWKNLLSPDPFLTLSNLQLEHNYSSNKKSILCDRFMNEVGSIKCRLNFELDSDNNNSPDTTVQQERPRKKGQKQKNYQSALSSSLKTSFQPSYKSKIIRGGYLDFYTDLVQK